MTIIQPPYPYCTFITYFVIMAHADYNCCAVCDSKMDYASCDARTKEDICINCLKNLRDAWINALDCKEFVKFVNESDSVEVKEKLDTLWFNFCCYGNTVDDAVKTKGYLENDK